MAQRLTSNIGVAKRDLKYGGILRGSWTAPTVFQLMYSLSTLQAVGHRAGLLNLLDEPVCKK